MKDADARQRRGYLVETEKFLRKMHKIASESGGGSVALAAGVKILGYIEDDRAVPTLLDFARAKRSDPAVRQEALIALRFLLSPRNGTSPRGREKDPPGHAAAIAALIEAAEDPDRSLAQTALHTLSSLRLPGSVAKRLEKLTVHPDLERASLAIEMVGRQIGEAHAAVLVGVVATTKDKRRAEMAALGLAAADGDDSSRSPGAAPVRDDAVVPLASLRLFASLVERGVDVGARLRKDRAVDLEHLYYVGFHFAERGAPLGAELLQAVVDRGGRSKLARMAKSKLALAQ